MDVMEIKAHLLPDHWSLFLRCTICFGYLNDPHTLECGHSFCRRCLKRLAEIAKEDNPDLRVRRLNLSCPTCRHPFPAKPVLKNKIRTCILLKQMVELWRRECKLLSESSSLTLRSLCTQTYPDGRSGSPDINKSSYEEAQEEYIVRMRPIAQYCDTVMKVVTESTDDINQDIQEGLPKLSESNAGVASAGERRDISSSSESSVTTDTDMSTSGSHSAVSVGEMFGRMSMPRITFQPTDCTPGRFFLMMVWSLYSVVIVGLSESFLPYVMLFTLLFFLIFLR